MDHTHVTIGNVTLPLPQIEPCECGAPHSWITWRGYLLGPLANEQADMAAGAIRGAASEAARIGVDPMIMGFLAIVSALPEAGDCADPEPEE